MTSPFLVTPTPPTSLEREPGQVGTFSFTITSLEAPDRSIDVAIQAVLLDDGKGKEVSWLVAGPQRIVRLLGGETETVTITARPTATTPRG